VTDLNARLDVGAFTDPDVIADAGLKLGQEIVPSEFGGNAVLVREEDRAGRHEMRRVGHPANADPVSDGAEGANVAPHHRAVIPAKGMSADAGLID